MSGNSQVRDVFFSLEQQRMKEMGPELPVESTLDDKDEAQSVDEQKVTEMGETQQNSVMVTSDSSFTEEEKPEISKVLETETKQSEQCMKEHSVCCNESDDDDITVTINANFESPLIDSSRIDLLLNSSLGSSLTDSSTMDPLIELSSIGANGSDELCAEAEDIDLAQPSEIIAKAEQEADEPQESSEDSFSEGATPTDYNEEMSPDMAAAILIAEAKAVIKECERNSEEQRKNDLILSDDLDSTSIYVGNVDYSATTEALGKHFQQCGYVLKVTIPVNHWTKHPKGFAYIAFEQQESVEKSMGLNGSLFCGRQITVKPKRTNIRGYNDPVCFVPPQSSWRGHPRGRGGYTGRGGYRGHPYVPYYRGGGNSVFKKVYKPQQ